MRWVVKLLALVGVVIIVSILTFLMTDFLPGDPAEVIAGSQASDKEFVENIREELNLDDPLPQRYLTWAGNAVQGDFGRSLEENDEPIADKLRRTIPNTVQLLLLAEIFSILIAVPIGVYSGYRANGKFDKFATGMAFFLLAIPVVRDGGGVDRDLRGQHEPAEDPVRPHIARSASRPASRRRSCR